MGSKQVTDICIASLYPLDGGAGRTHLTGGSPREDGLDHDPRAPAADDAKAQPLAVVVQLYDLHVTPLPGGGGEEEEEEEGSKHRE